MTADVVRLPTFRDLIQEGALQVGERVLKVQGNNGSQFYGDLTPDGRIRWSEDNIPKASGLFFGSPTAFYSYCGTLVSPPQNRANGFLHVFYKGQGDEEWMLLDHIRFIQFGRSERTYAPKDEPAGTTRTPSVVLTTAKQLPDPAQMLSTSQLRRAAEVAQSANKPKTRVRLEGQTSPTEPERTFNRAVPKPGQYNLGFSPFRMTSVVSGWVTLSKAQIKADVERIRAGTSYESQVTPNQTGRPQKDNSIRSQSATAPTVEKKQASRKRCREDARNTKRRVSDADTIAKEISSSRNRQPSHHDAHTDMYPMSRAEETRQLAAAIHLSMTGSHQTHEQKVEIILDSEDDTEAISEDSEILSYLGEARAPEGYKIIDTCPKLDGEKDKQELIGTEVLHAWDDKNRSGWFKGLVHSRGLTKRDLEQAPTANFAISYIKSLPVSRNRNQVIPSARVAHELSERTYGKHRWWVVIKKE